MKSINLLSPKTSPWMILATLIATACSPPANDARKPNLRPIKNIVGGTTGNPSEPNKEVVAPGVWKMTFEGDESQTSEDSQADSVLESLTYGFIEVSEKLELTMISGNTLSSEFNQKLGTLAKLDNRKYRLALSDSLATELKAKGRAEVEISQMLKSACSLELAGANSSILVCSGGAVPANIQLVRSNSAEVSQLREKSQTLQKAHLEASKSLLLQLKGKKLVFVEKFSETENEKGEISKHVISAQELDGRQEFYVKVNGMDKKKTLINIKKIAFVSADSSRNNEILVNDEVPAKIQIGRTKSGKTSMFIYIEESGVKTQLDRGVATLNQDGLTLESKIVSKEFGSTRTQSIYKFE